MKLIERAQILYRDDNQPNIILKEKVFTLDSTTVDLCLEVFMCADFRSTKASAKIHPLLINGSENIATKRTTIVALRVQNIAIHKSGTC